MSRKTFQKFDIFHQKRIVYREYAPAKKMKKRREPAPPRRQANIT